MRNFSVITGGCLGVEMATPALWKAAPALWKATPALWKATPAWQKATPAPWKAVRQMQNAGQKIE